MKETTELGLAGLSVTIPHKEEALAQCTQAESSAQRQHRCSQHSHLQR